MVHHCERVDTFGQELVPLAHGAEALVGYPFIFLMIDRVVVIVFKVKDDVVIRVAFSSWIVSVRVHFGRNVQVLIDWIIDLESILSLASIELLYHVLVWLVNSDS